MNGETRGFETAAEMEEWRQRMNAPVEKKNKKKVKLKRPNSGGKGKTIKDVLLRRKNLDALESAETADWANDCKKRELKLKNETSPGKDLAKRWKER